MNAFAVQLKGRNSLIYKKIYAGVHIINIRQFIGTQHHKESSNIKGNSLS